jgi:hypothetical protein
MIAIAIIENIMITANALGGPSLDYYYKEAFYRLVYMLVVLVAVLFIC